MIPWSDDTLDSRVTTALEVIVPVLREEGQIYVVITETPYDHPDAPNPRLTQGVIYHATFVSESNVNRRIEIGRSAVDAKTGQVHEIGKTGLAQALIYLGAILYEGGIEDRYRADYQTTTIQPRVHIPTTIGNHDNTTNPNLPN